MYRRHPHKERSIMGGWFRNLGGIIESTIRNLYNPELKCSANLVGVHYVDVNIN